MTQRYVFLSGSSPIYSSVFSFSVSLLLVLGYIGKKHLQKAIQTVLDAPLHPDRPLAFAVLRVPFFLEPHYDETKPFIETNRERLLTKWGAQWPRQKQTHNLKGRGIEAGIPHFNLDRLASNTMASHRLIQYLGKTYGLDVSEAVYDVLNVYYFVDGHSLNDHPRLAQVVANALSGLFKKQNRKVPTAQELLEFLSSEKGRKEIQAATAALQQLGIQSIPKFIIEGQTVVDGAALPDVFVKVFREIEERGTVAGGPLFREILGVSTETIARASHHRHCDV